MNLKTRYLKLRLTYANVMATVAVFFALGGAGAVAATHIGKGSVGTAQLKAGAVSGAKVKDRSLTGADVNAATLGQVPSAAHADSAANADHASDARRAESVAHADSATRADSAARADVATTASRALTAGTADTAELAETAATVTEPEAVHFLGDPGEPKASGTFVINTRIGFYRDREGVVHLQGRLTPNTELARFLAELPAGYRPYPQYETFYGIGPKASSSATIQPGGSIEIAAEKGETVTLDGISWRAVK